MGAVFQATGFDVPAPPWPRMAFDEAMLRFGSDRPDRRFDLEIVDISEALRGSEFKVFESVLGGGGAVRALNAGAREMSRSELEGLNEVVQRHGGKAVAWGFAEDGSLRSPIAKFLGEDRVAAAVAGLGAAEGDLLLFVADQPRVAAEALGALRLELAGASASSPREATTCSGWSTSRCSSPPTTAGARSTTPSPRRPATSPIPGRCARAGMT